ncbi:MAG: hypothetical protein WA839_07565 [Flavobacteriaceae bacterium]
MKFEDSQYFHDLEHISFEFPFGQFYFMEKFMISEIIPEIHLNWDKVKELISLAIEYYGADAKIGFISNRINSYSTEPESWIKLEKNYNFIVASAIVSYTPINYMNATLEKRMSKNSMKRCDNLDEAINWMLNLNEFKPKGALTTKTKN